MAAAMTSFYVVKPPSVGSRPVITIVTATALRIATVFIGGVVGGGCGDAPTGLVIDVDFGPWVPGQDIDLVRLEVSNSTQSIGRNFPLTSEHGGGWSVALEPGDRLSR